MLVSLRAHGSSERAQQLTSFSKQRPSEPWPLPRLLRLRINTGSPCDIDGDDTDVRAMSRHCDLCSPQVCESLITSSSRLRFLTRAQYNYVRGERACHQISKRGETDAKMIRLLVLWRLELFGV